MVMLLTTQPMQQCVHQCLTESMQYDDVAYDSTNAAVCSSMFN